MRACEMAGRTCVCRLPAGTGGIAAAAAAAAVKHTPTGTTIHRHYTCGDLLRQRRRLARTHDMGCLFGQRRTPAAAAAAALRVRSHTDTHTLTARVRVRTANT